MKSIRSFAVVLAAISGPSLAQAQPQSIESGRQIAQKFCSNCHAIGLTGGSPHRDAPPFREIAAGRSVGDLRRYLGEGVLVGHPSMPQWRFGAKDTNDLIAYLKSLGGRG